MRLARTLVGATAMMGLSAQAATECEQNYTARPSSDGGTIHQSFVGLYGLDSAKAMADLKLSAEKIHFQPVGDSKVTQSGIITTVVAQKASAKARGFPIVMLVAPQTDTAVLAFQLPKGATTDARGNICSFFDAAGLKGEATNASRDRSDVNSALALPLLAALNGDKNMEQAMKDATAAMEATATSTQALVAGVQPTPARSNGTEPNNRGAAPVVADKRKVVEPESAYNPADVDASMLAEGSATIRGFTCGIVGNEQQTTPNQPITLFPYSTYLKESIDLIDANRYKDDKVRVAIDKRIFDTRIDGKTNDNGDFQFTRIKPGRYIIMAIFEGSSTKYRAVPGSSYEPSTNTMYTWTDYEQVNHSAKALLQADVTVKQDGQVVDGVVVKPVGNGRLFPVLSSVCKWHHS
jgi:hypothetical protein